MALDEKDLEVIAALLSKNSEDQMKKMADIANAATTAQLKRFEAKQPAPVEAPKVETPKAAADPAVADKIKQTPELAALMASLEEVKKMAAQEREGRIAAETKSRDDRAYNALKSSLTGVKEDMRDIAAKMLFTVEKRVTFDEAGNPLFRMQRDAGGGIMEDVELPLASGVEHWQKSREASPFLPAPGQSPGAGRGGRSPTANAVPSGRNAQGLPVYDKPATTDNERIARATEKAAAFEKLGIKL